VSLNLAHPVQMARLFELASVITVSAVLCAVQFNTDGSALWLTRELIRTTAAVPTN